MCLRCICVALFLSASMVADGLGQAVRSACEPICVDLGLGGGVAVAHPGVPPHRAVGPAWVLRLGRSVTPSIALEGAVYRARHAGTIKNHETTHVGLALARTFLRGRTVGRLGIGMHLTTVVTRSDPPEPPSVGDVVIAIGDEGRPGLAAGVDLVGRREASWQIRPGFDLLLTRVSGEAASMLLLRLAVARR